MHRSRLGVDRTPLVRELASVEDEFGTLLTAVLDRTSARFFQVTAFGAEELPGLTAERRRSPRVHPDTRAPRAWENTPGTTGSGTSDSGISKPWRNGSSICTASIRCMVSCWPAGAKRSAVEVFLHPYLAERLMGSVQLDPKDAAPPVVHEATLAVREAFERATEREAAHDLYEGAGERMGGERIGR